MSKSDALDAAAERHYPGIMRRLATVIENRPIGTTQKGEFAMGAMNDAFKEWNTDEVQSESQFLLWKAYKAGYEDGMREGMLMVMNTEAGKRDYS